MRENICLSEPKLPPLICISLCMHDLFFCGFLCEHTCTCAWQACGGHRPTLGLVLICRRQEAHMVTGSSRETNIAKHAGFFSSNSHLFPQKDGVDVV